MALAPAYKTESTVSSVPGPEKCLWTSLHCLNSALPKQQQQQQRGRHFVSWTLSWLVAHLRSSPLACLYVPRTPFGVTHTLGLKPMQVIHRWEFICYSLTALYSRKHLAHSHTFSLLLYILCAHTHPNTQARTHSNKKACTHTNMHPLTHTHTRTHIYAHIHERTHARTRTHIHALMHIHPQYVKSHAILLYVKRYKCIWCYNGRCVFKGEAWSSGRNSSAGKDYSGGEVLALWLVPSGVDGWYACVTYNIHP
jgi:hypothetical protein